MRTAVRAFERRKNYIDELACYQRFKAKRVTHLSGFAVPELLGFSDELSIVEMTIVQPPYLLDFGI